ncbi:unnamed protein product [Boreogadus saida]
MGVHCDWLYVGPPEMAAAMESFYAEISSVYHTLTNTSPKPESRYTIKEGAKGRIGTVPLNANGRHLCTRPIRPRSRELPEIPYLDRPWPPDPV